MCLGIPMKLTSVPTAEFGTAELDGVSYEVNLSLIEDPKEGDFVIVHAGFAIERLDQQEADERLKLFREIAGGDKQ